MARKQPAAKPKPDAVELVAVEIKTIATFFYDLSGADYYRHTKDGVWITEAKWRRGGDCPGTGHSKSPEEIVDAMIWQLLGTDTIEESCFDAMSQWVVVNMEECKYGVEQIQRAIAVIVAHVLAGKCIHSEGPPHIVNQSGNPNYYDPKTCFKPFELPKAAVAALGVGYG